MTGHLSLSRRSRPGSHPWIVLLALVLTLGRGVPAFAMPMAPASSAVAGEAHCGSAVQAPVGDHDNHHSGDQGCCAGTAHLCGLHCASPVAVTSVDTATQTPAAQPYPQTQLSSRHRSVPPPLRPPRV